MIVNKDDKYCVTILFQGKNRNLNIIYFQTKKNKLADVVYLGKEKMKIKIFI